MQKKIFCMLLLLLGVSTGSWAATCTLQGDTILKNIPSTISVQRDTPVGALLWSGNVGSIGAQCTEPGDGGSWIAYLWYWSHKSVNNNMMTTNVPGVSYKIKIVERSGGSTPTPASGYVNLYGGWWTKSYYGGSVMADVYLEIYKTGTITSGTITGEAYYVGYTESYSNGTAGPFDLAVVNFPATNVAVRKCSINTTNLTFPIGNVSIAKFGSTVGFLPSGASNTQNLGLTCDPDANVNVSLQGTVNPDIASSSVLALTGQGTAGVASGVGVQILYGGVPLQFNTPVVLKQSAGGQESLPLTARYYQTKTTVTTGTANAVATLNLTYQ
ncbi:TPA: fimbrial protein [Enterobacter asburiae]|uniref:fimbrial protein n=1 Tax=Enterobacter asburiae TaxID=61645 RepID=UPI000930AEFC|nr:fimbrial protein [Enterobacter asburiae]MDL4614292.1 fimbrial protein [Enterobacter asburiae]HCM9129860.1 fimbrial protein [Enterobacter asburiae]HDW1997281.1 fimbrial protein [Enterobacter asburiae]HED1593081.1 fimbrial protein [Enterobacter asburiae]HED2715264.1 fimbrial protein [Enterobacter asburiae]